jgi:hypothetical protein
LATSPFQKYRLKPLEYLDLEQITAQTITSPLPVLPVGVFFVPKKEKYAHHSRLM